MAIFNATAAASGPRLLTRRVAGKAAVACLLSPFIATQIRAQGDDAIPEAPAFRSGVNLVIIDASITNAKNVPVSNLSRESFTIHENGALRELAVFETGATNVSIALVVDNSGSMQTRWENVMRSVQFFQTLLEPQDEAALSVFNDAPIALGERIMANHLTFAGWLTLLGAKRPTGRTALYDAVLKAQADLVGSKYDRRVMIVVSDGADTHSSASLAAVVDQLEASNILVYCVGLFEPGEAGTNASVLRKVANTTGGLALLGTEASDLSRDFSRIMTDLRARYVLGYRSADAATGKIEVRKISVTARDQQGKSLKVKARQEFRVPGADSPTSTKP